MHTDLYYTEKATIRMRLIIMFSFSVELLPEIHMFGQTTRSGEWRKIPHSYTVDVLVFVYKGSCEFKFSDESFLLNSGDVLFIPAMTSYTTKASSKEPCKFYYLHFTSKTAISNVSREDIYNDLEQINKNITINTHSDISVMPLFHFHNIYLDIFTCLDEYRVEVFSLLDRALAERNHLTPNSTSMISLYISQVFTLISRSNIKKIMDKPLTLNQDGTMSTLLQDVIYFIRSNFSKDIRIDDLCVKFNVSSQYLTRLFQKYIGLPPIKYINKLRISQAKDLIKYSNMPMKEIAYEIGIPDPYYFSRLFKKIEGISATEYKQMQDSLHHTNS